MDVGTLNTSGDPPRKRFTFPPVWSSGFLSGGGCTLCESRLEFKDNADGSGDGLKRPHAGATSRFGRWMTKAAPWPGVEFIVTMPPCSWMIFWAAARPSPVPFWPLVE